jgi:hypothetical protein
MKPFDHYKDEIARKYGFKDYEEVSISPVMMDILEEAAEAYAKDACEEQKQACASKARTFKSGNSGSWLDAAINKESILSTPNVIEQ